MYESQKMYLKAMKLPDIERVLPDPKGPNAIKQGPSEKVVLEQMKQQGKNAELQMRLRETTMKMMKDIELNTAKIHKLEAEAIKAIAEAGGVQTGHEIAMINTQIAAEKNRREDLMQAVNLMKDLMPQGEGEAPQQS